MNIHIHPVSLKHASRILKCLESAGRSRCFAQRMFIGVGADESYLFDDALGSVKVQLLERHSHPGASFVRKSITTWTWARRARSFACHASPSCVNVHGLSTLPLGVGLKLRTGCRLIYDTHELESRALAIRGIRRLYSEPLERFLIRYCDAVVCVSDGIADWYANRYGISRPLVVRNVPDRRAPVPANRVEDLRAKYRIPPDALLFVYQGRITSGRMIEQFLRVFSTLPPNYHIVFLGEGDLETEVCRASECNSNIHHRPAVPSADVIGYTAQADIGLVGVENRCLSYYFALPNKLFECLCAGVPVVAPCLPEIQRVVQQYSCGWTWNGSDQDLKAVLQRISPAEMQERRPATKMAAGELSWENEEKELLKLYRRLLRPIDTSRVLQPA